MCEASIVVNLELCNVQWIALSVLLFLCLSVCVSIWADSCPDLNFFCFEIGLSNLAHSTSQWEDVNIHDPNSMLTFDLKVKFIGIFPWLCVRTIFGHECISVGQCVTYIHELCMTLTVCLGKIIFALGHRHTKFRTWV